MRRDIKNIDPWKIFTPDETVQLLWWGVGEKGWGEEVETGLWGEGGISSNPVISCYPPVGDGTGQN